MNKTINIKVVGYLDRFMNKCIKNNIFLFNINYINDDTATMTIYLNDYKTIKKLNYYSKISITGYNGLDRLINNFKSNFFKYLIVLFSFILMDVLTSFIIDVNIIHENKNIRSLVLKELNNKGIKKYSLAYSDSKLEQIKKEIIKDNPNTLEWINITRSGMKYIVRIEERIIKEDQNDNSYRHVVATKEGQITKILSSKGEILVRQGDYVKKGDILISGSINLYDEIKGNTAATGTVYANVWYEATIKMPKKETITKPTGKKRYNLNINNKILLKNKYQNFKQENIKEIKILGLKFKLYKEVEYKTITKILTKEEIDKKIKKRLNDEFIIKLNNKGTIISQKILQKEEKNSTIEYRVFVVTNEVISNYSYYSVGDDNDS